MLTSVVLQKVAWMWTRTTPGSSRTSLWRAGASRRRRSSTWRTVISRTRRTPSRTSSATLRNNARPPSRACNSHTMPSSGGRNPRLPELGIFQKAGEAAPSPPPPATTATAPRRPRPMSVTTAPSSDPTRGASLASHPHRISFPTAAALACLSRAPLPRPLSEALSSTSSSEEPTTTRPDTPIWGAGGWSGMTSPRRSSRTTRTSTTSPLTSASSPSPRATPSPAPRRNRESWVSMRRA